MLPPHSPSSDSPPLPTLTPRPGGKLYLLHKPPRCRTVPQLLLPLPTLWWSLLYAPQITQLDSFFSSSWCPKLIFISKHKYDTEWWQKVIINIYCYDLKVRVPINSYIEILTPKDEDIRRWGLGKVLKSWVWDPHGWDQDLRKDPTESSATSTRVRIQQEGAGSEPGKEEPTSKHNQADTWSWTSSFRAVREIHLCCL